MAPKLDVIAEDNMKLASSNYAFAYLDVGATQYMGIMPGGISFRALYRNFGDSSMMFVVFAGPLLPDIAMVIFAGLGTGASLG